MNLIYIVKISHKYLNNIIRYNVKINKIIKKDTYYLLYLDYDNYKKILKYKKLFEIELVDYKGLIKYKKIFLNNIIFFIMFFLAICYLVFLSNIIFKIEVKTTNKELNDLVINELKKNDLSLYKFVKSFEEKENIKKKILEDNKDKIEWLEITRHGSKYIINVEERIIKDINTDTTPRDIVASKNAIIMKIDARTGSIVKKLNDYVRKGEVIVTGSITHKDSVVDLVRADATIYGETWYKVHVSYPFSYYEKVYTKNNTKRFSFNILNKKFILGKTFKNEEIDETKIMYNKIIPIKFSFEKVKEVVLIDDLYTVDEAYEEAVYLAQEKLLSNLGSDAKVLDKKKLKIIVNESTIDVDIFFKVYENITDIKNIEIQE